MCRAHDGVASYLAYVLFLLAQVGSERQRVGDEAHDHRQAKQLQWIRSVSVQMYVHGLVRNQVQS